MEEKAWARVPEESVQAQDGGARPVLRQLLAEARLRPQDAVRERPYPVRPKRAPTSTRRP
jgi:hypothetical protein